MSSVISLIVILAIVALVWWLVQQFNLPRPVYLVAVTVLVIVCILFLAQVAGVHLPR